MLELLEEVESSNERISKKRSAEKAKCWLYICNLKQSLGKSSTCGSKEGRIHCNQK